MATKFEIGDEVRDKKRNVVGILIDINPHSPKEIKSYDEYWGEARAGSSTFIIDFQKDVELVRRKAEIPAPKLPELNALRDYLSGAAHSGWGDDISIDMTDTGGEPDGEFLMYGTSETGKRFVARVTLSELEEEMR